MNKLITKICALIIIFLAPIGVRAANVQWNMTFIGYEQEISDGSNGLQCTLGKPYLNITETKTFSGLSISAIADSNLANANTFVLAYMGDIISQSYFDAHTSFFSYAKYGEWEGAHADYSIILDGSENIYLAFSSVSPGNFEGTRYGWMELGVREDGYLDVVSSAWNLDGESIKVGNGAIPEPTSGVLMLIGVACLALKRRNFHYRAPLKIQTPAS